MDNYFLTFIDQYPVDEDSSTTEKKADSYLLSVIPSVIYPIETRKYLRIQQNFANSVWNISHNLDLYPVVTIADLLGELIYADIQYADSNNIIINFTLPMSGYVTLVG